MIEELKQLTKLDLTINQLKVIKDKYLRDSPTVESWLRGVCHNIALADILHSEKISEEEIFYGINHRKIEYQSKNKISKMFLLHNGIDNIDTRNLNFGKFLENLENINVKDPEIILETEEKFYELLSTLKFLPNSPTLMNAGRALQQLSACYVLPVEDSISGIYTSVKNMALVHQSGGGTGFSFSRLRPTGDAVKKSSGVSSGPVSFMQIFDKSTDVVKQGGTRRGANMGILHYNHPDILSFIDMKKTPGTMENFNISVTIDNKFMQAVKKNEEYELINPKNKEVVGKLNAKEVWRELVKGAWETGDPGIIIIDRINNTGSNATPHLGQIESTNPCVIGDTLISTEKGLMRMEKLVENYSNGGIKIATDSRVPIEIKNRDGTIMLMKQSQKNSVNFDTITRAFATGVKQVYKIKTNSGYELECTEDHKLLTNKGWIKITDLNPEKHVIYIQKGEGIFNKDYDLPIEVKNEFLGKNGRKYSLNLPKKWSKELGQVLGWLIGDGWLIKGENCRVGFTFGKNDLPVMNYLKPLINNYYGKNINEIKRENGVYHLSYHSKYFVDFFEKLGVKPCKAGEKIVPEAIFTAPKATVVGFLQGLFTADGTASCHDKGSHYYTRLTSKSEELLKGVQLILLNLGIKSTIYNRDRKPRKIFNYTNKKGDSKDYLVDGKCFELNISRTCVLRFLDLIGFMCDRHVEKTKNFYSKNLYQNKFEEKIDKVIPLGEKRVYDLTEPRTLSFITNGIISLDCGEQPLLPYEPCNLGSINLLKFVKEDGSDFDYEELKKCVYTCTHFLDNVIDINNYPIPEIEEMAKKSRRIGLGVMGWAESLVMLKIPYNSPDALKKAEEVMKFINLSCLNASEEIAEKRGIFPAWKGSIYDRESQYFRNQEFFPRHSARTTIAPTGTIGITAGLQGAGIEPFFAVVYIRYNAAGIDALKKGDKPEEKDTFFEINPLFEEIAEQNNYFGLKKEDLYMKINDNHKSLVGIEEIPEPIQKLFLTSHDLKPREHVLMQCAFQKHIDNAVSKTVNLKNEATEKDVEEVYLLAYENGAKGVTVYRDGSKQFQILNINEKDKKEKTKKKNLEEFSDYHLIQTGHGPVHLHINYNEEGITKIFANLSPTGTEISGMTTALAIILSKYFELGGDPIRIIRHLNSIKSEKPYGFGKNRIDSVPHAMSIALRNHLIKTGKIKTFNQEENDKAIEIDKKLHCSKCFSANVGMISGCSEPTCFDCGYSKCS